MNNTQSIDPLSKLVGSLSEEHLKEILYEWTQYVNSGLDDSLIDFAYSRVVDAEVEGLYLPQYLDTAYGISFRPTGWEVFVGAGAYEATDHPVDWKVVIGKGIFADKVANLKSQSEDSKS